MKIPQLSPRVVKEIESKISSHFKPTGLYYINVSKDTIDRIDMQLRNKKTGKVSMVNFSIKIEEEKGYIEVSSLLLGCKFVIF